MDRRVEDTHAATMDIVGQPKCVKHGERMFPKDITFGMPTMKFPEEGVEKLIGGDFSCDEQTPDSDLGKSLREGWRNLAPNDKATSWNKSHPLCRVREWLDYPKSQHKVTA